MTSGNSGHDSDSSQSAFPGEGLPPEQFRYFDELFSNTWKGVKLSLVQQPELQHRARYLTEGSRGPIKNRTYDGYPTILVKGQSPPCCCCLIFVRLIFQMRKKQTVFYKQSK